MNKRKFFSIKYQKHILPDNKNFWNIARDEAVYRLDENKKNELFLLGAYGGEREAGEVPETFQNKKLKNRRLSGYQ